MAYKYQVTKMIGEQSKFKPGITIHLIYILALIGFMIFSFLSSTMALSIVSTPNTEQSRVYQIPEPSSNMHIYMKAACFDPIKEEPGISPEWTYTSPNRYFLVQFHGPIQSQWITDIQSSGAVILGYIPQYSYLLSMDMDVKERIENLQFIRWIGLYHPAYKIQSHLYEKQGEIELNLLVFEDHHDNLHKVRTQLMAMGGEITYAGEDNHIIRVKIDASELKSIAFIPEVEWIDLYSKPVATMNKIRAFTGANTLSSAGFTGSGIVGEVKDDGIDQSHPDFDGQLIGTDGGPPNASHGTCAFGVVFSNGGGDSNAMGMLPGGKGVFCDWGVSTTTSISNLVYTWGGVFQSNSWSAGADDSTYTTVSFENDEAIDDFDIVMLHSAGNDGIAQETCTQDSVAKNVIGVGAVTHYDNILRSDDKWVLSVAGSTPAQGPASDGRVKPDLVGPFDSIYTTDVVGNGGYNPGDYYNFAGTSGATPVVAGAVGLVYQMYKENFFGNNPGGGLPHASTVKALLIANAYQYDFSKANRFQQGWGGVDVGRVYEMGQNHFIVNEDDSLQTGFSEIYEITTQGGEPLKISLVWTDLPQPLPATKPLINDLHLKVTDPNNVVYWGNVGLNTSKWSSAGGSADTINNVENVFIENPTPGFWTVEVIGGNIPLDGDPTVPGVNQAYALIASNAIETLTVDITNPSSSEILNDIITITGISSEHVSQVEVRIDSGSWELASGTTDWSFEWDTRLFSDGDHTIYVRGVNGTMYSKVKSVEVSLDNTPPTTSIIVGDPKYLNGSQLFVSDLTQFNLNAADSGSGLFYTRYRIVYEGNEVVGWTIGNSFTLSWGEGYYTIQYDSEDMLGNKEATNTTFAYVDSSSPKTSLQIGMPKYRDYSFHVLNVTNSTPFTILLLEEASSVDFFWYTIDGAYFLGQTFDLTGFLDGIHIITWGSQDVFGFNESGNEINVTLDSTAPDTFLDIGPLKFREFSFDLWNVTSATQFSLSASDTHVGINFTWYTIDGIFFMGDEFNLTGFLGGLHTICWGSEDHFGNNETDKSKDVILDSGPPNTIIDVGLSKFRGSSFDSWNVTPSTKFTLSSIDDAAGVDFTWYTIDGVYFEGTSFTMDGLDDGLHTIAMGAMDNLGNNRSEAAITVYLDSRSPESNLSIGEPKYHLSIDDIWNVTESTSFLLSSWDEHAGVKSIWFKIDGVYFVGSLFNLSGYTNGFYTIVWGAIDNLGHNETGHSTTVFLDTDSPYTELAIDEPKHRDKDGDIWNISTSTTFSLLSLDNRSGVKFSWFTINGMYFEGTGFSLFGYPEGYYIIIWGSEDFLGNNETGKTETVYLSSAIPTTTLEMNGERYWDSINDLWIVTDETLFLLTPEPTPIGINFTWYMIDSNYFVGAQFSLSGIEEGIHRIKWGSQDTMGFNETENFQYVILDLQPPETNLTMGSPKYREPEEEVWAVSRNTKFTIISSDNHSGVSSIWYMIDDDFFLGSSFTLDGYDDGPHRISWGAVDNLGYNETKREMNIFIDNDGPTVTFEIGEPNIPYNDYILINSSSAISFNDEDSGVGNTVIYYSIDGGITYQVYDSPFTVPYKTMRIIYWAEDILGNRANEYVINVKVDNTDTDSDKIDDIVDTDDDGDGLLDIEEDINQNGIVDPEETDPKNPDTDYDGYLDGDDPYPLDKSDWEGEQESVSVFLILIILVIVVFAILFIFIMIMDRDSMAKTQWTFPAHPQVPGQGGYERTGQQETGVNIQKEQAESIGEEEIAFEPHDEESYEEEVEFEPHDEPTEEEVEFEPHDEESYEEEVEFEPHDEPTEEEVEFEPHDEPDEEVQFEPHDELSEGEGEEEPPPPDD
ncbi:MAG: S8 family serine peptidase [Thermoplasmata archaeon]|nr:MAG: S8 family serine peptidase [Thermoplasmata archaeon]